MTYYPLTALHKYNTTKKNSGCNYIFYRVKNVYEYVLIIYTYNTVRHKLLVTNTYSTKLPQ